jgi:Arc-like DNA binding dprotein
MPKLNLRLSEAMRRKLQKAADHNGRSMQTEILHRLQLSFEAGMEGAIAGQIAGIDARIEAIVERKLAAMRNTTKGDKS